jgi:hypothetical protein
MAEKTSPRLPEPEREPRSPHPKVAGLSRNPSHDEDAGRICGHLAGDPAQSLPGALDLPWVQDTGKGEITDFLKLLYLIFI